MRQFRWPIRTRLTALYAAAFLVAGLALVAVTYWLVSQSLTRHVDATRPHSTTDPGVAAAVREQIETFRAETLGSLLSWSILALAGALVLAVILGWVLAGRALRPLHQVTQTATRIAGRNLHERIALAGPNDELKELADTIDEMLERLDRAFDAQRRFVANASHELRTPLAVNRTMLEVAVGNPEISDDLRVLGPRLLATNERSERMVEGLLTLARSEQRVDPTPIDLAEVAEVAVEHERAEALERGVHLTTDLRPAPTTGNLVLVERLAANLVQNAVRHSPFGAKAVVRTGGSPGHSFLEVENSGVHLHPAEIDELFEPFRRGNGRASPGGVGLGLSIVRSVAQAHGGKVSAHPGHRGGLVVRAVLPVHR